MNEIRVLCIGDSLSLPRKGCEYQDTWYARIKKEFSKVDFISCFRGGMLVPVAKGNYDSYFKYSDSNIAVIQLGICDCAPRYINNNRLSGSFLVAFFTKLKMSKLFWKVIKMYGRSPECVYTDPETFETEYSNLVNDFLQGGGKNVVLIKVGHGDASIEKASKFFNSNVDRYNNIIENIKKKFGEQVITIDPLNKVDGSMFVDGYHCNKFGMDAVYKDLSNVLHNIIDRK